MKTNLFSLKIFLLFIFIVGVAAPVYGKPGEWLGKIKKVEVLKSTKAEVEKMFGNPPVTEVEDLAVLYKNGWGEPSNTKRNTAIWKYLMRRENALKVKARMRLILPLMSLSV